MRVTKFFPDFVEKLEYPNFEAFERSLINKVDAVQGENYFKEFFNLTIWTAKYMAKNLDLSHIYAEYGSKKLGSREIPAATTYFMETQLNDSAAFNNILNLHHFWSSKRRERFVFSESFFTELKDTNISKIRFNDLYRGVYAVKLPYPIVDNHGDMLDEFLVSVGSVRDYFKMDESLAINPDLKNHIINIHNNEPVNPDSQQFCITWSDNKGQWNFVMIYTNENDELITDMFKDTRFTSFTTIEEVKAGGNVEIQEDGFHPHIRSIFNCLVYLSTGNPDLRKVENDITYKGPGSPNPVRRDKDLAEGEFTVVGYNFKKRPNYNQDYRYQPSYWARRGLNKVLTRCKGSLQQLRKVNERL